MIDVSTKAKPILFSGPMVRAILEGRKTQTRRIIKSRYPFDVDDDGMGGKPWPFYPCYVTGEPECEPMKSPYKPGGLLWVRETWYYVGGDEYLYQREPDNVAYRATETLDRVQVKWRPSIFMPRWASRITLEVTNVRVERLQSISVDDVYAEGLDLEISPYAEQFSQAEHANNGGLSCGCRYPEIFPYKVLWTKLNGPESWDRNDWVWVYEFKRVELR